jgi:hypothetical protein
MKAECKVRDSNVEGLSKMNKSHLLDFLVEGSSEWISNSKEELLEKHVHNLFVIIMCLQIQENFLGQPEHEQRGRDF